MTPHLTTIVEPFVRHGLFANPEQAMTTMAREYVLRQIEYYQTLVKNLQTRYGMTYEQFEAYLRARAAALQAQPDPALNVAVMAEEDDALEWKIAREMLQSWLGLQAEAVWIR